MRREPCCSYHSIHKTSWSIHIIEAIVTADGCSPPERSSPGLSEISLVR
ncbi:hypothetical protein BIFBIF_01158 [Bifidobacterium bifidum ATCC 29521 = JCM 1255 = DSM 20456]|nr:hypothetical protein BIFBIF_01158 [Bifidobacterium bifidum ATCC 29521 = JCM 1255 = DSM 20456]